MNKIWSYVCFICIIVLIFINPTNVLPSMLSASNKAIRLSISLCAMYAVWLGFFEIINKTKIPNLISKLLSPLINIVFGKNTLNKETKKLLSLSVSSNMLGLGGAATPMSIKTIESMWNGEEKVTFAMTMFVVINATGLQVLPTTVMGILSGLGDINPERIIIPSILSSFISTLIGILLVKIFVKRDAK